MYMTRIVMQDELYLKTAHPNVQSRYDKEGETFTEYTIKIAEKNSKEYTVRGVKSMAEAIRWVEENGTDSCDDDGVRCDEIDGSWEHHCEYAAKGVEVNKYSACAFKGRCFDEPSEGRSWDDAYIFCTSYLEGHDGGICIQCMTAIEKGWVLRPLKTKGDEEE